MSTSTIEETLNRIKAATLNSPIAVFTKYNDDNTRIFLDSMFADTVDTRALIKSKPASLVGVFSYVDNLSEVRSKLHKALAA